MFRPPIEEESYCKTKEEGMKRYLEFMVVMLMVTLLLGAGTAYAKATKAEVVAVNLNAPASVSLPVTASEPTVDEPVP